MKIWEKIKKIIAWIGYILAAIFSLLFLCRKNKKEDELKKEEEIKNESESEIKKTDAADLVANSTNQDDIQQSIDEQREDFRKRVRDRLNKKL